jgi:hypothetical protein
MWTSFVIILIFEDPSGCCGLRNAVTNVWLILLSAFSCPSYSSGHMSDECVLVVFEKLPFVVRILLYTRKVFIFVLKLHF